MKRIKQTLCDNAGVTLAEMLLAILIMLLVSVIMVGGIPAAKDAYEKVVLASNAEVLLSTAISELRNELGTARDVEVANNAITFRNSYTGSKSKLFKSTGGDDPEGTIMLQRYAGEGSVQGSTPLRLVSKKASDGLYIIYVRVDYNSSTGVVTFHNLQVKRESSATALAEMGSFSIRVFAADKG